MLKKLIKYEWKSTYKIGGLMLLVGLGITVLGMITMSLFFGAAVEDTIVGAMGIVIGAIALMLFILCLVSISYGMLIYLGIRFYRGMYKDEGYLTHTLPVTTHELLFSKLLIGGIWTLLTVLLMGVSVMAFVCLMVGLSEEGGFLYGISILAESLGEFIAGMDAGDILFCVAMVILTVLSTFASIAGLFGSISMGQLCRKHRGLMGIVFYFLYLFAVWLLSMIVSIPMTIQRMGQQSRRVYGYGTELEFFSSGRTEFLVTYGVVVLLGVGMYFLAHHINEKKLNME